MNKATAFTLCFLMLSMAVFALSGQRFSLDARMDRLISRVFAAVEITLALYIAVHTFK